MLLNNLYDFDKTILRKNSILMFYFFGMKKRWWFFWHMAVVGFVWLLAKMKIIKYERFKEACLFVFRFSKNKQKELDDFAEYAKKFVNDFYVKQMQDDDVVCSDSPEFLVGAIMEKINPKATLVGSKISFETLKFEKGTKRCYAQQKVVELKKFFGTDDLACKNAFSDSLSDIFLFELAVEKAFLVKNGKLVLFKDNTRNSKKAN